MPKQTRMRDESKVVDRGGRPPALKSEQVILLRAIVTQMPHATLDELAVELECRCAVRVCAATIRRTLRAQGIVRLMPKRRAFQTPASSQAVQKRYGYTVARRRKAGPHYSTYLTDAEWALVADLFERPAGGRATPAHYERRHMVDAFERMQDRLRRQWRLRMWRSAEPTAAVIDAQSTRSSPQGGDSGFDAGKKVKGRKRHMVVDTFGLLLAVTVTAASVQVRDGAKEVVEQACRKAPPCSGCTPMGRTAASARKPSSIATASASK